MDLLRSEERRVGKGVDLGGCRIIKKKMKLPVVRYDKYRKHSMAAKGARMTSMSSPSRNQ